MDLNTKLSNLNDFYCTECKNFLNPPIMLTKNAENICGRCFNQKVRTRSDYFLNIALENIIKQLIIPCRYKTEGCKIQLTHTEMYRHEKICLFRKHKCPITNCVWTGALSNLLEHFETAHEDLLIISDNNIFNFMVNINETPILKNNLLVYRNELFYLRINSESELLCFTMSYIGQDEQEDNFEYCIEDIGAIKGICFKQNEMKSIPNHTNFATIQPIEVDMRILKMCNSDELQVKLKIFGGEASTSGQIDENILMHLECPICNQYMLPPIHQCLYGHNVCNKCRPKIGQCPTCRGRLENTRNYALEAVSEVTKYPCINRDSGCTAVVPGSLIEKHENECKLQKYFCPIIDNNCTWQGRQSELMAHLVTVHELNDEYQIKINIGNLLVNMHYSGLMNNGYNNYKTLIAYGEIFKIGYKFYNSNTTYWSCKVVGAKNRHHFKYEIIYSNDNQDCRLVRNSECHVFVSDDEFYANCLYFANAITSGVGNIVTCKIRRI